MKKSKLIPALLLAAMTSGASAATIVINEAYGGGGNSGAPYNQDFVELFNNSVAAVDISGFTLAYASAAGTFTTIATIPASTSLAVGAYYVVTAGPASGTVGVAVPNINQNGSTGTNLSASAGKLRLSDSAAAVVDLLGYGSTASSSETSPAPAPSNTLSAQRVPNGADTDNNSVDFISGTPTPGLANVPEPSTALSLIGGLGVLVGFRRIRGSRSSR